VRVLLISRYPRVDTPGWKRNVAQGLIDRGLDVGVLYSHSSLADQARAGLKEFGPSLIGRYLQLRPSAPGSGSDAEEEPETLGAWAAERSLPVMAHARLGDPDCLSAVRDFQPDLAMLAGSDIVPASLLELPRIGTLNPHYGLLPKYRGMNVTEWSIYHDDPVGVTVHYVSPGIDTGDIVASEYVRVTRGDDVESLRPKHQRAATSLLLGAADGIAAGRAERTPQRLEDGRQYYRMHPALRAIVERKLADCTYRWVDRDPDEVTAEASLG
jgi:methionyl-tRNA formyltransferase